MDHLPYFGFLWSLHPFIGVLVSLLVLLFIGYLGSPLVLWALVSVGLLFLLGAPEVLLILVALVFLLFLIPPIRQILVTSHLMKVMKGVMPPISDTERTALEAGVVWVEGDLFSGKPDFNKILQEPYPELTAEEKAFIDNQTEELCRLVDPWQTWKSRELPDAAWEYMKKEKFLGMIIPKEYGGLGFSALAHSEVIQKIASRSVSAAVTVMVPNSLGPAELLVHYGTDEQKNHYLPRLAAGLEIPCFALTEPTAGSDAASINSEGVLFKDSDGSLKIRLNWNKRWITLAAISTVVGMAFRLRDPDNLLGKGEDVGITCALIPANTPGVQLGQRHDPLNVPFYNCPTRGFNVVVGVDTIIGGIDYAGKGWSMLMDSLAAGRGISLPAQATGGAKLSSFVASAHAAIRKQFGIPIGKFEGVEEPLARIFGFTYILEAMRRFTLGALDKGVKPPVITAIAKYNATELGRKIINDAMDVMGGAGISMGPRNTIGEIYIATPVGITVEGANILTRTLMIFGQGALRAHPYAFKEVDAVLKGDLAGFDRYFWSHIGHVVRNTCRSIVLSLTRGYAASVPANAGELAIYYRRLTWASATFAIMSDIAMGSLGGSLKFKEKLTGRYADILSWMYICTAVLRRFEAEGRKKEDLPFVKFSLKYGLQQIQSSFDGIFDNLKVPGLSWFIKGWIGAWSRVNSLSSHITDNLTHAMVDSVLKKPEVRNHLTKGIHIPKDASEQVARLASAFDLVTQAEAAERKIRAAISSKVLPKKKLHLLYDEAVAKAVITAQELELIKKSDAVRFDAVQVDDFNKEQYHSSSAASSLSGMKTS